MNMTFAVFGMGPGELVIVVVAILVLFGAKKIPEFARGLGKGINEFKKASSEVTTEIQNAVDQPVKPATPPAPVQGTVNTTAAPASQNPPAQS